MRSLFIQLSLLAGAITSVNLIEAGDPFFFAVLAGVLLGCSVCFLLLLGDFTVHRVLEDKVGSLTSVTFIEETPELDWLEESIVHDESDATAREAIAA